MWKTSKLEREKSIYVSNGNKKITLVENYYNTYKTSTRKLSDIN